jgi:hypothetical protein
MNALFSRLIIPVSAFSLLLSTAAPATAANSKLRDALLLHASFDKGLDADFAVGDPKLYSTGDNKNRVEAKPGLPAGDIVKVAKGQGRHGDALQFTTKMKPTVFFHGEKNLNYQATNWSGSASFWMKLDPDKDLEPGYCDPVQFVAQAWGEGNMFVEFSKDETPRHFRYAIMCITKMWNPNGRKWEEIPVKERPMVQVEKPPFGRDRWTHITFTFTNINSGKADAVGKLYMNGEYKGSFDNREQKFNWDVSKSAVTMGLSYIGMLDDLAIFNRPLTEAEVKAIYQLEGGISKLK